MKVCVIFCKGREHWVVATSIGCEIGIVNVYDSLFNKLDEKSKYSILNYLPKDTIIKLVVTANKQIGSEDCGIYAIAYCTSLAFGYDLCKQRLVQEKMRHHLVTCFRNNKLTVFPFN